MTALRECILIGLAAAPARRKYVKPFKWFKFDRARRYTAK